MHLEFQKERKEKRSHESLINEKTDTNRGFVLLEKRVSQLELGDQK